MQIRADKYRSGINAMPTNRKQYTDQVNEWQNNNWQTFINKYSLDKNALESDLKALESYKGLGLSKLLREASG